MYAYSWTLSVFSADQGGGRACLPDVTQQHIRAPATKLSSDRKSCHIAHLVYPGHTGQRLEEAVTAPRWARSPRATAANATAKRQCSIVIVMKSGCAPPTKEVRAELLCSVLAIGGERVWRKLFKGTAEDASRCRSRLTVVGRMFLLRDGGGSGARLRPDAGSPSGLR